MHKIAWCLINYGPVESPIYGSHLRAIALASRTLTVQAVGQIAAAGATDRMYTHSAENMAVREALDLGCTHVFMTEKDMLLPDDTLVKLLEVDQPIVAGLYFLRNGYGQPCLYKRTLDMVKNKVYGMTPVSLFPTTRPFRLNGCPGLGCVLIRREVFERVPEPWFDLRESRQQAPGYGSDIYFFSNCEHAGIPVWVHPGVRCGQMETVVWDFADYEHRLQTDPDFRSTGFLLGMET